MIRKFILVSVAVLALAGCSRSEETAPLDNIDVEAAQPAAGVVETPSLDESVNTVADAAPPAPAVAIDRPSAAQVQEDADASGMTSRLPEREENVPVTGNADE